MTLRRGKRYSTQSFQKKELTEDPYSMKQAPKGLLECPECHAVYFRKRWSLSSPSSARSSSKRVAKAPKKPTKEVMIPQSFVCPACRKLRDGYAEGFLSIQWPNWGTHKAAVLGLIHNEEKRASRNNPLERIMTIRTRPDGADLETTTEHFAQSLGMHLDRAFRGKISYHWSHKDKMARIAWQATPTKKKAKTR